MSDATEIKSFDDFVAWVQSCGEALGVKRPSLSYDEFVAIYEVSYRNRPLFQRLWKRYIRRFPVTQKLARLLFPDRFNDSATTRRLFEHEFNAFNRAKKTCAVYGPDNDAEHIRRNLNEYRWFHNELADAKSKSLLVCLLIAQITKDDTLCPRWYRSNITHAQYFDKVILGEGDNEVFVDCGAAWGDTYDSFRQNYSKRLRKAYLYECSPSVFRLLLLNATLNLWDRRKVVLKPHGVDSHGHSSVVDGQVFAFVTLDDDLPEGETITFLKMDVEGHEIDALLGARKRIARDRPKLAICSYHKRDDIFQIARCIKDLCPDYRLYIRYYLETPYCDTVLYAVPAQESRRPEIRTM